MANNTARLVALVAAFFLASPAMAQRVVRSSRPVVSSSETSLATLVVQPPAGSESVEVIETIPLGWSAFEVSNGGLFDGDLGEIVWNLPVENPSSPAEFALTYRLQAQSAATGHYALEGAAIFHDGGDEETEVSPSGDLHVVANSAPAAFATRTVLSSRVMDGGAVVLVSLDVQPIAGVEYVGVEEIVPTGWAVSQVTGGGVFNRDVDGLSSIRWSVFAYPNAPAATLAYTVSVPPQAARGQFNLIGANGANFSAGSLFTRPLGDQRAWVRGSKTVAYAILGQLELDAEEADGHNVNADASLDIGDAVTIVNRDNVR